jgi:uncharacterized protein (DUF305 family)
MNGVSRALILALTVIGSPAFGQQHDMAAGDRHQDMRAAMERMNRDMGSVPMTGDTDRDFVAMMIPHHQGAIDMAETELRFGKDPALRRLATDIVAAQQHEIAMMQRWQAKHRGR